MTDPPNYIKKDAWNTNTRHSKDFEDYGPAAMKAMAEKRVPSFMQTLHAKDVATLRAWIDQGAEWSKPAGGN